MQGAKDLFEQFEKFLKQRQYKLNDVTELLSIKELRDTFKEAHFLRTAITKRHKKGTKARVFNGYFYPMVRDQNFKSLVAFRFNLRHSGIKTC